jgi:hypothetical protein
MIRNAGFIACLVGALVLVASRYITGVPHDLRWVGLAIVVLGWALFAWSMIRRARWHKVNG